LASLVDYCKANQVTTIFSEAFENPDVADSLARDAGAQVKSIYTIESVENGKSYLERMKENLSVIYETLK
jgi:zinc transport system substrate-binding protein